MARTRKTWLWETTEWYDGTTTRHLRMWASVTAIVAGMLMFLVGVVAGLAAADRAACTRTMEVQHVDRYWSWWTGCIPTDPSVVVTQ